LGVDIKNYDKNLILFHTGPQELSLYESQIKYHISQKQLIIQETVMTKSMVLSKIYNSQMKYFW